MPRFDQNEELQSLFQQIVEARYKAAGLEARSESAAPTQQDRIDAWFEEHPEAHQALLGVNPFTGEPRAIFERKEIEGANRLGPAQLDLAFLKYLAVEMRYNPEWREHHR